MQIIRVVELVWMDMNKYDFDERGQMSQSFEVLLWFADISKAFDSFSRIHVLNNYVNIGFCDRLLCIIGGFFVNRCQHVSVGTGKSDPVRTLNGGSQGSNLTLVSFLLSINDTIGKLSGNGALYVDDLSGWLTGDSSVVCDVLNSDFNDLFQWSGVSQQKFHPDKFHHI